MKLYWSDRANEPFFRLGEHYGYSGEAVTFTEAKNIVEIYRKCGNPILTAHVFWPPHGEARPEDICETRSARNYCEGQIEKMEEFIQKVQDFIVRTSGKGGK